MVQGEVRGSEQCLVRFHSECMTGDVFGSIRCDCAEQLHAVSIPPPLHLRFKLLFSAVESSEVVCLCSWCVYLGLFLLLSFLFFSFSPFMFRL